MTYFSLITGKMVTLNRVGGGEKVSGCVGAKPEESRE